MAESRSTRKRVSQDRPIPPEREGWRLGGWVFCSCLIHGILILGLFVFPRAPFAKAPIYPVYTVELLGGDKVGGKNLGTVVSPEPPPKPAPKKKPEKVKVKPPPPKPKKKEPVKKEKVVVKKEPKKAPPKKPKKKVVEVKKEPQAKKGLPEPLREKMYQAAINRAKNRLEAEKKKKEKEEVLQSGPGEGEGAVALGEGGKGGGIVKGLEFIIYRNRMLHLIRESWTWVGKRDDVEVKVRFGIREDGEIVGLRIMEASGDPSYDDSVFRAVKKASPLPPPPENYREEFMDVRLTFRPKDLGS
jgi:TonB family protein